MAKWKWRGFDPEKATEAERQEYIRDAEELNARIIVANQQVQAVLDDKKLWEDLQIAAWALSDKTEELNDSLRGTETLLKERGLRPGWVPLDEVRALVWNGDILLLNVFPRRCYASLEDPPTTIPSSRYGNPRKTHGGSADLRDEGLGAGYFLLRLPEEAPERHASLCDRPFG